LLNIGPLWWANSAGAAPCVGAAHVALIAELGPIPETMRIWGERGDVDRWLTAVATAVPDVARR